MGSIVDQPPLIPFLIHVCRALLGDSLRSIRFIPALASSLLIVQTAAIARELGGAVTPSSSAPSARSSHRNIYPTAACWGPTVLEPSLWMGCAYFAILAIKRNDPRYWLWFGVSRVSALKRNTPLLSSASASSSACC